MTTTIVTGSSSGIGYATALHLARRGHHVFASMRNPECPGAEELRKAASDDGLKLDVVDLDVDSAASVDETVADVLRRAGRVDALVNNAGVGGGGALEETDDATLKAVFETNFFGAMRMARAVIPGMRRQRKGRIVNVTSVGGRVALGANTAYIGSKWALEAATQCLGQELYRFNIRVSAVEPGTIRTPIFAKNAREPDLASPYAPTIAMYRRYFATTLANPTMPGAVAEVIAEAIESQEPKVRYMVGWDAEAMVPARDAISDEEHVAFGREMSDEEFGREFKRLYNMDI